MLRFQAAIVQVVEGLAVGTLRFSRALLRTCRPMLVSYYREHFEPAFVAPDDGELVVILLVEGIHDGLLGPFPHAQGIARAAVINTACGNLLFAVPEFSVRVGTDDARIWVNCRANGIDIG